MKTILGLFFILLTITACRTVAPSTTEYTIGMGCGHCMGQCFTGFRIAGDKVVKLSSRYINDVDTATESPASASEATSAKQLISAIPKDLDKYPERIGCPDCADQCAIYLSVKSAGKTKTIIIDPDDHPSEFDAFVAGVREFR